MAISYPVTPPSSPRHSSIKWKRRNVVGMSENPYTLKQQIFEHDGSGWAIEVAFDPMSRSEFAPWDAFLGKLHGPRGTFYYGDELRKTAQGSPGGTPLVNGASQTGFTLTTDGWTVSTTVLKAGDMFQIDSALYEALEDVTSDGSGNATIELWPRLRGHADNAAIDYTAPVGVFRLASPTVETIGERSQFFRFGFTAIEAI